jgi:hypothetical protein
MQEPNLLATAWPTIGTIMQDLSANENRGFKFCSMIIDFAATDFADAIIHYDQSLSLFMISQQMKKIGCN